MTIQYFSLSSTSLKLKTFLLLTGLALTACGGGGGGGGSKTGGDNNENAAPVADAGSDMTVDEGETVTLQVSASDSDGDITGYSWTQLSDTKVSLTLVELDGSQMQFTAPDTIEELTLQFRVTVTDDEGATGTDTVAVTVNPVNAAPEVRADLSPDGLDNGQDSTLFAEWKDSDGAVVAYQWEQVSGPEVELEHTDRIIATIPAQGISEPVVYEFQVTVTDNEGATATDTVEYTLYPANYPRFFPTFPEQGAALQGSPIRLVGRAYPEMNGTTTIGSVAVESQGESYTVTADGVDWSAESVPVSLDEEFVKLVVRVEDSEGRVYPQTVYFRTGDRRGSGPALTNVVDVVTEDEGFDQYVLVKGETVAGNDLIKVTGSGHREGGVTDNSNTELGPQIDRATRMLLDEDAGLIYIATQSPTAPLVAVNLDTGARTLISGPEKGTGPAFETLVGLDFGATRNDIYVADNAGSAVYHIDVATGNRTHLGDVNYPLDVAYYDGGVLVSQNLLTGTAVMGLHPEFPDGITVSGSAEDGPELLPYSQGIYMSADKSNLFFFNANADQLLEIDMSSGNRREIANGVTGSNSHETDNWKGVDFDEQRNILYVVGGDGESDDGLYAVDPVQGTRVLISR